MSVPESNRNQNLKAMNLATLRASRDLFQRTRMKHHQTREDSEAVRFHLLTLKDYIH